MAWSRRVFAIPGDFYFVDQKQLIPMPAIGTFGQRVLLTFQLDGGYETPSNRPWVQVKACSIGRGRSAANWNEVNPHYNGFQRLANFVAGTLRTSRRPTLCARAILVESEVL
jgi:hypothetical protein